MPDARDGIQIRRSSRVQPDAFMSGHVRLSFALLVVVAPYDYGYSTLEKCCSEPVSTSNIKILEALWLGSYQSSCLRRRQT